MKTKLFFLLLLFLMFSGCTSAQNHLYIASWNLENLFDNIDDAGKNDKDFLPNADRKWNHDKLEIKYKNLGKVINFMNDGNGPDLLGVVEVEHENLLENLIKSQCPNKKYRVAYFESPDNRGIDNGLIYDSEKFELVAVKPHEVFLDDGWPTRFVLEVVLKYNTENLHVFVNHWPSRRGGAEKSAPNRAKAATTLSYAIDEVKSDNPVAKIIVMGDFNDESDNASIVEVLGAKPLTDKKAGDVRLYNLSNKLQNEGLGTYLYRGDWNMLDHIMISPNLLNNPGFEYQIGSFEIIKPDFIIQKDGKYKGSSLPTYGGRKYLGGYSDHFAVGMKINLSK